MSHARQDGRLLTHDQEIHLIRQMRSPTATTAQAARASQTLIERNQGLVVSIAKKYLSRGLPYDDLVQEANIGLMKALSKYDPSLGYRLSTYATWWIRQAVMRAVEDKAKLLRLPVHFQTTLRNMKRAQSDLSQLLGREPSDEELACELACRTAENWTPQKISDVRTHALETTSLDQQLASGAYGVDQPSTSRTLASIVADADPGPAAVADSIDRQTMLTALQRAINDLPHAEREVIRDRYGLTGKPSRPLTQLSLALGVSTEQIKVLQERAETLLRDYLRPTWDQLRDSTGRPEVV